MIITKTPFRVSFVGGGTDLRSFYKKDMGSVLSFAINKFIYVVVKKQIGIVEYKYRINWSKVEFCNSIDEIEHPIVRECLKFMKIDYPLEITTFADIPANTGLGSSSAFTVGLLKALYGLRGEMIGKYELAQQAASIEVDILGRNMGKQDHFASAYGGVNVFNFYSDERVEVSPVIFPSGIVEELENSLLLFYTKLKRDASEILKEQNTKIENLRDTLIKIKSLVPALNEVLVNGDNMKSIGKILEDSWFLKKVMTNSISSPEIDSYYKIARTAGALGGKILGAGGGGFLLFYVENDKQEQVIAALKELYCLRVKVDFNGSNISYYDPSDVVY